MRRRTYKEIDPEFKPRLDLAFKALRRKGLITRQNFLCCQNCAGYALTEMAVKLVEQGKPFNGTVFYHAQDNANRKDGEDFYLAFGDVNSTQKGRLGLDSATVGRMVVEALAAEGLETEWNGDPDTRILVRNGVIKREPVLEFAI